MVGVAGSVGLGLLIAALVDRVKRESIAKTFIFLPLAISLVGASVIWRFVYAWVPEGRPQYGLLNAIWTSLGQEPVPWVQTSDFHINTFVLIVILIWLQTGFAMVVLSAAIKGVPAEMTEAARLDGATERQLFFRVIVPMIMGSLITVTITTAIVVLKIFDIVYVMTGGRFNTDVVANQMYLQAFQFFDVGRASALAVILFVAVLPLMLINIRNIRRQGLAHDRGARLTRASGRARSYRSVFVRRLPLRIAVIAICVIWFAADAGAVRELAPGRPRDRADRLVGRAAASLPDHVDAPELRRGAEHREHGQRVHQQPHRDHPVHDHPHHGRRVRGVRVRLDALPAAAHAVPLVVALLVVPLQMALIPVLELYRALGLNNSFLGVWLAHTAFGLPLAIFLLYNFISQLPGDLFETASIDGATHFQMFTRVVLPALGAGARGVRDLPVPVGLERPARRARVPERAGRPVGPDARALADRRRPRPAVAPADRGRVRDDDPAGPRVPGCCSATSCGASSPAPSRGDRARVPGARRRRPGPAAAGLPGTDASGLAAASDRAPAPPTARASSCARTPTMSSSSRP